MIAVVAVAGVAYYYGSMNVHSTRLIVSTTTSTADTGLLEYTPYFDAKFHANLTWLSLGTGQALATAARGDADVLLVHDRVREDAFVESGNGPSEQPLCTTTS